MRRATKYSSWLNNIILTICKITFGTNINILNLVTKYKRTLFFCVICKMRTEVGVRDCARTTPPLLSPAPVGTLSRTTFKDAGTSCGLSKQNKTKVQVLTKSPVVWKYFLNTTGKQNHVFWILKVSSFYDNFGHLLPNRTILEEQRKPKQWRKFVHTTSNFDVPGNNTQLKQRVRQRKRDTHMSTETSTRGMIATWN